MDSIRLQRMSQDVSALNVLTLSRVREAVNTDPRRAAQVYGLSLVTAQRIGRLPHGALARFGEIAVPLLGPELEQLPPLLASALASVGLPPGQQPVFADGSDPVLAQSYLHVVRDDAWRYPIGAAARWRWPLPLLETLVEHSASSFVLMARALRLRVSDGPLFQSFLAAIEAAPLEPVADMVRLGAVATMLGAAAAPEASA